MKPRSAIKSDLFPAESRAPKIDILDDSFSVLKNFVISWLNHKFVQP